MFDVRFWPFQGFLPLPLRQFAVLTVSFCVVDVLNRRGRLLREMVVRAWASLTVVALPPPAASPLEPNLEASYWGHASSAGGHPRSHRLSSRQQGDLAVSYSFAQQLSLAPCRLKKVCLPSSWAAGTSRHSLHRDSSVDGHAFLVAGFPRGRRRFRRVVVATRR